MTVSERLQSLIAHVETSKKSELRLLAAQVKKMEQWNEKQAPILDQAELMGLHPDEFVRWLKKPNSLTAIWNTGGFRVSITIGDDK